jgi:NAD(P) transhydrogenase subunit alpha
MSQGLDRVETAVSVGTHIQTPHPVSSGVDTDFAATAFIFTLACFIGLGVIKGVSRLLHTPLMSLTNAISAIAVLGAILLAGGNHSDHIQWLGAIAVFASTINAVSGFLITQRMLGMFKSKQDAAGGKR